MKKIILASLSPRRKELLLREGIDFIVDAASLEEILDYSLPLEERLIKLSLDKVTPIHNKYPNDIVIGADTTVYHNNKIIGKAKDEKEARNILNELSNDMHKVYTAVSIYNGDQLIQFIECTKVYFKDITDMIDEYIASNDWIGKAGAYGIQGNADIFVDHTEGDIDSVIGLPVKKIIKILNDL